MGLACDCGDFDGDGFFYEGPSDYEDMPPGRARKRRFSCRTLIDPGAVTTRFKRWRQPNTLIEEKIWGTDVNLADWWLCEECSDLYFSLTELGFCLTIGDQSMKEMVAEYAAMAKEEAAAEV